MLSTLRWINFVQLLAFEFLYLFAKPLKVTTTELSKASEAGCCYGFVTSVLQRMVNVSARCHPSPRLH